jgi:transaldolase/transaldolase/glucose-6-phosphate isomerase
MSDGRPAGAARFANGSNETMSIARDSEKDGMINSIRQITNLGQGVWLDFISRDWLRDGRLAALVETGLTGVTSNPTIFQKSVAEGEAYDDQIAELAGREQSAAAIFEAIAVRDIGDAADVLRPVYDAKRGRDGFVSIEVSPHLAHDTQGTVEEGRRLFAAIGRPNVMIKVPGTEAGLPAISALIGEGINVNVTLIFSIAMYERIMQAYLDGLRRLRDAGRRLDSVASVASFFVSRVDTLVDKQLEADIAAGADGLAPLLGRAAVANAKLAYDRYKSVFRGQPFAEFAQAGARVQRPLWASTSTKNPDYPDLKYVEPLIGPNTVNTVPPQTLEAIRQHAVVGQTVEQDVDHARAVFAQLAEAGIDMNAVTDQLLVEGVKSFADSFDKLLADIEAKRDKLAEAK